MGDRPVSFELSSHRVDARLVLEDVEAHRLGQRPALSDGDDVSLLYVLPAGRAVHRHVLVALLEPFDWIQEQTRTDYDTSKQEVGVGKDTMR